MLLFPSDVFLRGSLIPVCGRITTFLLTTDRIYGGGPIRLYYTILCGTVSSVGMVTDYELDCSGSNSGGDEIFRHSRPALGLAQPPVKWIPCLFRWGKVLPGRAAVHSPPSSAAFMEE